MNIFNSLGSNYNLGFSFKSIFRLGSKSSTEQFSNILSEHYAGQTTLTYKGREALELAFLNSNLEKGSRVGINAYTCYVVYRAIKRAGFVPVFIDTKKGQLNFSVDELERLNKKNNIKAIVLQNTLGYPADIKKIKAYSEKNNILIVEDLAHSLGSYYEDNIEVGTVGSFTMMSFSQDKPLDVVAGGALIDRRKEKTLSTEKLKKTTWQKRQKNRYYPFWTILIRKLYPFGIGRVLHHLLKKLKLLTNPMDDAGKGIHHISPSVSSLAIDRWQVLKEELRHRKAVAAVYEKYIDKSLQLENNLGQSSYLRFPILVDDRASLISILKKNAVYIGDTWYDAPIGPKKYLSRTSYKNNQCPNAEYLSSHMVNLPTHLNINESQAKLIAERINLWLKSQ
jgi:dTDP-4-amino-4,6-dideoxygalactose transaminase